MKRIIVALSVLLLVAYGCGCFMMGSMYHELQSYRMGNAARLMVMSSNTDIFSPRQGEPMGKAVKRK